MKTQSAVRSCSITQEGIEIHCDERRCLISPFESAELLRRLGYIKRYTVKDGLMVICEIIEELVDPYGKLKTTVSGRTKMTWEYFVRHFELGDEAAEEILSLLETTRLTLLQ